MGEGGCTFPRFGDRRPILRAPWKQSTLYKNQYRYKDVRPNPKQSATNSIQPTSRSNNKRRHRNQQASHRIPRSAHKNKRHQHRFPQEQRRNRVQVGKISRLQNNNRRRRIHKSARGREPPPYRDKHLQRSSKSPRSQIYQGTRAKNKGRNSRKKSVQTRNRSNQATWAHKGTRCRRSWGAADVVVVRVRSDGIREVSSCTRGVLGCNNGLVRYVRRLSRKDNVKRHSSNCSSCSRCSSVKRHNNCKGHNKCNKKCKGHCNNNSVNRHHKIPKAKHCSECH